jgi:hypothetical protein
MRKQITKSFKDAKENDIRVIIDWMDKKWYLVSTIEKFRMILKSFYKIIFLNLIEYENILIYLHRVDLF